jgi:hypothetical protein
MWCSIARFLSGKGLREWLRKAPSRLPEAVAAGPDSTDIDVLFIVELRRRASVMKRGDGNPSVPRAREGPQIVDQVVDQVAAHAGDDDP